MAQAIDKVAGGRQRKGNTVSQSVLRFLIDSEGKNSSAMVESMIHRSEVLGSVDHLVLLACMSLDDAAKKRGTCPKKLSG